MCIYIYLYIYIYISPFTWQLFQKRVWLRKQIIRLRSVCQHVDIPPAWLSLTRHLRLCVACVSHVLRHANDWRAMAEHVRDLRQTKAELRRSIRNNVRSRIAPTAQTVPTGDVVSRLQSLLGPSARKTRGARQLPGLTLKDGSRANSPAEVEAAWVDHFSSIEAGVRRTAESLARACLQSQRDDDLEDLVLLQGDLPSLAVLETAFRQTMLHRAFGTDGIPAEALHAALGAAAPALYPVVLKCAFRVEEPLHLKAGSLYAVWKGKSSPGLCSSYRGILVSSTVGKAYHRILKSRNVEAFSRVASLLQVGGLQRPVTLAAHVVRLHQQRCNARRFSQGILLFDFREAFHRIVRRLVTGFTGSPEVAAIVAAVQLPAGVMHELKDHLQDQSFFRRKRHTLDSSCSV